MRKRWICLPVVCILLFSLLPAAFAAPALTVQQLFEQWETDGYPEDVGGVYYDAATGKMCIELTDNTAERQNELLASIADPENTGFSDCTYSHRELCEVQDAISGRLSQEEGLFGCGVGWMTDEAGNVIGFGPGGKESRVVIDCSQDYYSAHFEALTAEFGDKIAFEIGEAPFAEDDVAADADLSAADTGGAELTGSVTTSQQPEGLIPSAPLFICLAQLAALALIFGLARRASRKTEK